MSETNVERRDLLKAAFLKIAELEQRLASAGPAKSEPIAILGVGCRFPGGADTPDAFWRLLDDGVDAVSEIPADRWDVAAFYDPRPATPGKMYSKRGGFIDGIDQFDPQFFGIAPREAMSMDPQQRLLLEVSWEALERAGAATPRLSGSSTGVFVGICSSDYSIIQLGSGDPSAIDTYFGAGIAHSIASGRLSYALGLQGPSLSVDTACSSSLLAVHLACLSLRAGECDMAIAGGVSAILTPVGNITASQARMLSPDGRCKTFDASADGYVRAEGCGMIVLKPLAAARAAGDRILAVIRGTAVNQDGRSNGLTAPNGLAQEAVVRSALADAGVTPSDIDYVEAHGTGTSLGDPIEVQALAASLGAGRDANRPLIVGAVKSNIGHLEAAAGIAGVVKVVESLRHDCIPRTLHVKQLNPNLAWDELPVVPAIEPRPWPRTNRPRLAGVSSFGFSGTNVHLVVEEAPASTAIRVENDRPSHVLALSAKSEAALRKMAARYADLLAATSDSLADVCFAANAGRTHQTYRLALVTGSRESAAESLAAFARDGVAPGVQFAKVAAGGPPKLAFLFSGQGAQYARMGQQLYESQPTVRRILDRCDALLRDELGTSLLSVMFSDDPRLNETAFTQPALFALEYALAELWRSWGVQPAAVAGHSLGEYAAAVVSGVLTFEEGVRLSAVRGRLMQSVRTGGGMAVVFASENLVRATIAGRERELSIAAINGPQNVVIAGERAAVDAVCAVFASQGVRTQALNVSHAFHSPLMDSILPAFEQVARSMTFKAPALDLISNVTGRRFEQGQIPDAAYWTDHIRKPVRFAAAMEELAGQHVTCFIEVGPGNTLLGMGRRCVESADAQWLPSLRKDRDEWSELLHAAGALYVSGVDLDWRQFDADYKRSHVDAPTYPFERARYWVAAPARNASLTGRTDWTRPADGADARHPFLISHAEVAGAVESHVWEGELSIERFPFLRDHQVQGVVVVPAATYMETSLAAAAELLGGGGRLITNTEYHKPLVLQSSAARVALQVVLSRRSPAGDLSFSLFSRPLLAQASAVPWSLHCTGTMRTLGATEAPKVWPSERLLATMERCGDELAGEAFYNWLGEKGNQWGPCHQGVERVWRGSGEALGRMRVPALVEADVDRFHFHPAVADACGHVLAAVISLHKTDDGRGGAFVGAGVDRITFTRRPAGQSFWVYASLRTGEQAKDVNILEGDIEVIDDAGEVVLSLEGVRFCYLEGSAAPAAPGAGDNLYEVAWEPSAAATVAAGAAQRDGAWLILADELGVGDALARRLQKVAAPAVVVQVGEAFAEEGDRYHARPGSRDDLQSVLQSAFVRTGRRCAGIVHLSGAGLTDADGFSELTSCGCGTVLELMHALEAVAVPGDPRVWVVTRGAQQVASEPVTCAQATLWGFGRSLALEASERWGGLLDLDPQSSLEDAAGILMRELGGTPGGQLAFRGADRYVARLVRSAVARGAEVPLECRADGSYVITGGFGGLGFEIADLLVRRGARRLILLGRTALPPRDQWSAQDPTTTAGERVARVKALERAGASVHIAAVDIADEQQVGAYFETYEREGWPQVRGVVHAAGLVQYESVQEHAAETMAAIFRPKVIGASVLDRLFSDPALDFFVLFSSASAVLSSPMMTSYAAANAYLDALARRRRVAGLPGISINWGAWADVGMATKFERSDKPAAAGTVTFLSPAEGLRAFERVVRAPVAQVAVMPIDWTEWRKRAVFQRDPLLAHFMQDEAPVDTSRGVALTPDVVMGADPSARPLLLETYVVDQLGRAIGIASGSLDPGVPVVTLGFDSLMAVELKNQIEADLRVVVPMVQLVQGPSARELAAMLLTLLGNAPEQPRFSLSDVPGTAVADAPVTVGDGQGSVAFEEGEL